MYRKIQDMKKKLVYIYQDITYESCITIQTIDNLNYLAKYFDVESIFSLYKSSTDDINVLKDSYKINESIT